MKLEFIVNLNWSIYINGWFYHQDIYFLDDGTINNAGAEGFSRWHFSENHLIITDELGEINYKLKYIQEARIWISISSYRKTNNNIMLSAEISQDELSSIFDDYLSTSIANKSASYKGGGSEIWGHLFFGIDGRIYNYHHENESFWTVENNKLYILDSGGKKRVQSIATINNSQDFLSIIVEQIGSSHRHFLNFTQNKNIGNATPRQYLKIDTSFSNANDTLMVFFNSAGSEYHGYNAKYEFFNIPFKYPVDYIRIAQSAPTRYYLDDMDYIRHLIDLKNYKKIICIGMSIGGYGAMWLSEFLSENNKQTKFYSIAIQAISSLDLDYANHIREKFSEKNKLRAKTLNHQRIYEYEKRSKILDIADFLTSEKNNVTHHCLFDGLNDFESANILRLTSSRVKPIAIPLGVNHIEGCGKIGSSGLVEKILDKIIFER